MGTEAFALDDTASLTTQAYVKLFAPFLKHMAIPKLESFARLELQEGVVYNIVALFVSSNARIGGN